MSNKNIVSDFQLRKCILKYQLKYFFVFKLNLNVQRGFNGNLEKEN